LNGYFFFRIVPIETVKESPKEFPGGLDVRAIVLADGNYIGYIELVPIAQSPSGTAARPA
jgi:hypothetical protein